MTDRAAPRPSPKPWLAAAIVVSILTAAGALVACSSDGTTPKCTELPLYDVNDASTSDIAARKQAESEGCVTGPGTATGAGTTNPPPADAGGD